MASNRMVFGTVIGLASFDVNRKWIDEHVSWKDFGTGVRLGKLAREGSTSPVLYDVVSDVTQPHSCLAIQVEKRILLPREKCGMRMVLILKDLLFGWNQNNPYSRTRVKLDFRALAGWSKGCLSLNHWS